MAQNEAVSSQSQQSSNLTPSVRDFFAKVLQKPHPHPQKQLTADQFSDDDSSMPHGVLVSKFGALNRVDRQRLDFLFSHVDARCRADLLLDEVALFSVSHGASAVIQASILQAMCGQRARDAVVTECGSSVGGNTLALAHVFRRVNAVEKNPLRFRMLQHNVDVTGSRNVFCQCADYIAICGNLQQDVVFMDPPWGGPGYKKRSEVHITLSNLPLQSVVHKIRQTTGCRTIGIKLPANFAIQAFLADLGPAVHVLACHLPNMTLLVLSWRPLRHFRLDFSVFQRRKPPDSVCRAEIIQESEQLA